MASELFSILPDQADALRITFHCKNLPSSRCKRQFHRHGSGSRSDVIYHIILPYRKLAHDNGPHLALGHGYLSADKAFLRYSCHKKAFRLFIQEKENRQAILLSGRNTGCLPVLRRTFYDMFVRIGKAIARADHDVTQPSLRQFPADLRGLPSGEQKGFPAAFHRGQQVILPAVKAYDRRVVPGNLKPGGEIGKGRNSWLHMDGYLAPFLHFFPVIFQCLQQLFCPAVKSAVPGHEHHRFFFLTVF